MSKDTSENEEAKDVVVEGGKPQLSTPIAVLAQEVVDKIAAGEVVQRPASVVKELLENCLDAGSSHVVVHVEKGGLLKLTVTDDGCGIPKGDLALAATRHATSKLSSVDDFGSLQTFGFRGEALASMSMVSRLTITSRTGDSSVAYTQSYRNGAPAAKTPRACARKLGTTISIQDLFYNVPHRKNAYSKRENDEYSKILQVVQYYSIHYAHKTAFCCERVRSDKTRTLLVDLNTSQLSKVKEVRESANPSLDQIHAAKKQVLAHVFDPAVESQLSHFDCSQSGEETLDFAVSCKAYYSCPSYNAKTTKLIIFLNHRLVDLPVLKRSLEDVYAEFTKTKPIIALDITVPGIQVDVNVHPSKRQVALMHQDEVCNLIASKLRESLQAHGQSFRMQSVTPKITSKLQSTKYDGDLPPSTTTATNSGATVTPTKRKADDPASSRPSLKRKWSPSRLIRTNGATPVGAIEPFLVSTQPISQSPTASPPNDLLAAQDEQDRPTTTHKSTCPMSNPDLSEPGAFATLRCQCDRILIQKSNVVRPKKVIPTQCSYTSISSLRKRVNKKLSPDISQQLKQAYFVGVVSNQRSLIQCGEKLVLINHFECAKELFYQLALARFGGATMANLGADETASTGLNIQTLIEQALQLEDDLIISDGDELPSRRNNLLDVSEVNQKQAADATACLVDHADMLEDYFKIRIDADGDDAMLMGLPVLMDGHIPQPHGLGIFLLRLATQVEWTEERPCFHGVCQELGNYYAMLPLEKDVKAYVQHTLFPAISYLLLPSERIEKDGFFVTMTTLSTLYKVFERC